MGPLLNHVVLGVVGAVSFDIMSDIDHIDKKLILQGTITGLALGATYTVLGSAAMIGAVCMAILVEIAKPRNSTRSFQAQQRIQGLAIGTIVGFLFGQVFARTRY